MEENFKSHLKKLIYLKKLVLKLEHSGSHATFLNLNITISNGKISTELYNKCDDIFLLFACQTSIATFHGLFFIELCCLRSFVLQDRVLIMRGNNVKIEENL